MTVAVRRVNLTDRTKESLLDFIPAGMTLLPNTAGCYTAEDAVRAARLGREVGLSNWVKLEVLGDEQTLWPDNEALLDGDARPSSGRASSSSPTPPTIRSCAGSSRTRARPPSCRSARRSARGSGSRIPNNISIILERAKVPVIVDAGVGTASDACVAMELGAAGVLMNTGIAGARDPVRMARAMRDAVAGGAGRLSRRTHPEEALRDGFFARWKAVIGS